MHHKRFEPMSLLNIFEPNDRQSLPEWYQIFAETIEQREIAVLKSNEECKLNQRDQYLKLLISKVQNPSEQKT